MGIKPLTSCRPIGLSEVARWWHGRHNQVEGNGDVHGSHMAGACADHANLVMGLEVHVRGPACKTLGVRCRALVDTGCLELA